jgi:hypothetical protein
MLPELVISLLNFFLAGQWVKLVAVLTGEHEAVTYMAETDLAQGIVQR